jgi:hypothetical protein
VRNMQSEDQIQSTKDLMSKMLRYLGRKRFSVTFKTHFKTTVLTYNTKSQILTKEVTIWGHKLEIKEQSIKEKAIGGHNSSFIFKEIKAEFFAKVKEKVQEAAIKQAVEMEAALNGIDMEEFKLVENN